MEVHITPKTVQIDDGKNIKGLTYPELRELIKNSPRLVKSVSYDLTEIVIDMVV